MSMTSQGPEVMGVILSCRDEPTQKVCARVIVLQVHTAVSSQQTHIEHVMDVFVPRAVAHHQVIAVPLRVKHWFWWRELWTTGLHNISRGNKAVCETVCWHCRFLPSSSCFTIFLLSVIFEGISLQSVSTMILKMYSTHPPNPTTLALNFLTL